MCDTGRESTVLRLRNKAKKLKIQLKDGEFHCFSCVASHEQAMDSCMRADETQWVFWPDASVAVHLESMKALASLSCFDDLVMRWKYDKKTEALSFLEVCHEDAELRDRIIETFANAALMQESCAIKSPRD